MIRFPFPIPTPRMLTLAMLSAFLTGPISPPAANAAAGEASLSKSEPLPDMELSANRPGSALGNFPLTITRLESTSTARGALARVEVTLSLSVSPPDEVGVWNTEGILTFAPAPGWEVTGAALDIEGEMRPASLTQASRAETAYRDVVSRNIDPCLIRLLPDGRVRANVFPINRSKPRQLRLEFSGVLTPGNSGQLEADFPIRFPQPVADAALTTDFDPAKPPATVSRPGFSGGADAKLTQPPQAPAAPWTAEPDGQGGRFFQGLLPAEPLPTPRHLLVLADVSRLQQSADRATERALLTSLIRRMGTGRVTFTAFSTLPEAPAELDILNGECPALLTALDSGARSGAPRPGAVDVSAIPADLVVIISTLADPLGSGGLPKLPDGVPVAVIDTVSPQPSAPARHLAESSGGVLLQRGSNAIPECRRPLNLKASFPPDTTARALPGRGWWLVTGRLPDKTDHLSASGPRPEIIPGTDSAAGRLLRENDGRGALRRLLEIQAGNDWSSPPDVVRDFPVLTPETSLIVLENAGDYARHGIAPPRGLDFSGTDAAPASAAAGNIHYGDYPLVAEALARAPGTAGAVIPWWENLTGWKKSSVNTPLRRLRQFRPERPSAPILEISPAMRNILLQFGITEEQMAAAQAGDAALPRLERAYHDADAETAVKLLSEARRLQIDRLIFFANLNMIFNGGCRLGPDIAPPPDPFSADSLEAGLPSDFLIKGASGSVTDTGADPFAVNDDSRGTNSTGETPPPDTADFTTSAPGTEGNPTADNSTPARQKEIPSETGVLIEKAGTLRQSGDLSGALRALTELALPQPNASLRHSRLRLLAWQLIEWDQPALALEVLRQARRLFGDNDTTLRDLALALRDTGDREAADRLLSRVSGGVASRDLAALRQKPGSPPALRVVMECAGSDADADLEIEGPDDERAFWKQPLPTFGGALSFDGTGIIPEDFILAQNAPFPVPGSSPNSNAAPESAQSTTGQPLPLTIRIRLQSVKPEPVRVTVFHRWNTPNPEPQIFLLPACPPGVTTVTSLPGKP